MFADSATLLRSVAVPEGTTVEAKPVLASSSELPRAAAVSGHAVWMLEVAASETVVWKR